MVARRAHNPEAAGSNPASATKDLSKKAGLLFAYTRVMRTTSVARWGEAPHRRQWRKQVRR